MVDAIGVADDARAREAGGRAARRRGHAVEAVSPRGRGLDGGRARSAQGPDRQPQEHEGQPAEEHEAPVERTAGRNQPAAKVGEAARAELDLLGQVLVSSQGQTDAMTPGGHPVAHQAAPLRVRGPDELVVEVDVGARRMRDDLQGAGPFRRRFARGARLPGGRGRLRR